jgi:hypothetical protein
MTMLALGTGFFGTVFGMIILCSASFVCGVMFKTQFLKLITAGRYQG